MALFLITLLIGNLCIPESKAVTRKMIGHDFLAFYTAGSFLRQGRSRQLYNLDAVKEFEQATAAAANLEVGKSFGPWWNPPFYALAFEPLARWPYPAALVVWRWISLSALAASLAMLAWMLHRSTGARVGTWGLVPLLVLVCMPFVQALSHGQNTFTSLLLLTAAVAAWRAERGWLAGMAAGLLFYKPQLAAVVAAALVCDLGLPALGGLALVGVALLLVNVIMLPGTLGDFLHQLPANVRWMQVDHEYLWERHVTLKAFWRLLLQGRKAGEPWLATTLLTDGSLAMLVAALAVAARGLPAVRACASGVLAARGDGRLQGAPAGRPLKGGRLVLSPVQRDRWITAAIVAMPLLMPFYFDYDLLLLAIPATLYAAERVNRPKLRQPGDSWLARAWVALFFWLFVNPGVGLHTHVDVTVLLLSAVAGMHAWRAARTSSAEVPTIDVQAPIPARLAA